MEWHLTRMWEIGRNRAGCRQTNKGLISKINYKCFHKNNNYLSYSKCLPQFSLSGGKQTHTGDALHLSDAIYAIIGIHISFSIREITDDVTHEIISLTIFV